MASTKVVLSSRNVAYRDFNMNENNAYDNMSKVKSHRDSIEMSDNRAYIVMETRAIKKILIWVRPPTPLHYPIMNNHTHFNSCMAIAAGDTCLTWT